MGGGGSQKHAELQARLGAWANKHDIKPKASDERVNDALHKIVQYIEGIEQLPYIWRFDAVDLSIHNATFTEIAPVLVHELREVGLNAVCDFTYYGTSSITVMLVSPLVVAHSPIQSLDSGAKTI
jgi:hypothetical protein